MHPNTPPPGPTDKPPNDFEAGEDEPLEDNTESLNPPPPSTTAEFAENGARVEETLGGTTSDEPNQNGSAGDDPPIPFAPGEPTDGRLEGDSKSRYQRAQWTQIGIEAIYLLISFVVSSVVLLWAGPSATTPIAPEFLDQNEWKHARPFTLAFFGGALGGTLFALKWLYHSVAKGIWNHDRILWRLFAPLLSAGAATTFVILSASGVLPFFGRELASSPGGATGIGLLVGFFSDRAFSMFENTVQSLFGPAKSYDRPTETNESKHPS